MAGNPDPTDAPDTVGSLRVGGEISPPDHKRLLRRGWRGALRRSEHPDPERSPSGPFRMIAVQDPRSVV